MITFSSTWVHALCSLKNVMIVFFFYFSFSYLFPRIGLFPFSSLVHRTISPTFITLVQRCPVSFLFINHNVKIYDLLDMYSLDIFRHKQTLFCKLLPLRRSSLKDDEEPWSCMMTWLVWMDSALDRMKFYEVKSVETRRHYVKSFKDTRNTSLTSVWCPYC